MKRPIVLGAGPAGCMAAVCLAKGGAEPILIDRDAEVGDALCGGFLSWRSAERLLAAGIDLTALGAHAVKTLHLFAGNRTAEISLPDMAWGLSRHALDSAMRAAADEAGAELQIDRARRVAPGVIEGESQEWRSDAIFLATGKHDVRGQSRPREADDPALGMRMRVPANPDQTAMLEGRIELHLFRGGYAGIVLQEDGSANICLALRKSLLAETGGDPRGLLDAMADRHPHFANRMAFAAPDLPIESIGAVPYGWIARETRPGLYRLGDQAAVIPSLAGEGMGIAMASGAMAAKAWLAGEGAESFQHRFAARASRPVNVARSIWHLGEGVLGGVGVGVAGLFPTITRAAMRWSRID